MPLEDSLHALSYPVSLGVLGETLSLHASLLHSSLERHLGFRGLTPPDSSVSSRMLYPLNPRLWKSKERNTKL